MSHADDDPVPARLGHRARLIQNELRLMLLRWDPIGVADANGAADEYDCMIGPLLRLLVSGGTTVEITKWLATSLDEHFGLVPVQGSDERFAEDLQRWWVAGSKAREA